jgi:hypothetical protein
VYKDTDGNFIKRPVVAWMIALNDMCAMAGAVHPGVTEHTAIAVAVIDPHGVTTVCASGRTFGTYQLFLAWIQAGGVVE